MNESRRNTIVGMFAIFALVAMTGLVFMFGGGRSWFADRYPIRVYFPNGVTGIAEGQSVTLSGKRIGETTSVEFHDTEHVSSGVDVIVSVDGAYDLPSDAIVRVAASIMGFGRPAIQIHLSEKPGAENLPRDGTGMIRGEMIAMLDQLLPPELQGTLIKSADTLTNAASQMGDLAGSLKPVTVELTRLLESRKIEDVNAQRVHANLDTVVQRMDGGLKNLNDVLGDPQNQENLRQILANGRQMTERGTLLMDDLRQTATDGRALFTQGQRTLQSLAGASDQMSSVLVRLDKAATDLSEGRGTAGLFLRDNRLYEELVLSARRLTKALDDIRDVMEMAKRGELKIKAF